MGMYMPISSSRAGCPGWSPNCGCATTSVSRVAVLFVIDRARFQLAVDEAQATVLERRAQLEQAQREARRNRVLKDLIAAETVEIGDTQVKRAEAALATAEAALGVAQLDWSAPAYSVPWTAIWATRPCGSATT